MMLKVLDLFSGIGGFSLGLERTGGFETVAFCEIEKFPQKVLKKHWPKVPIYEDVRTLTSMSIHEILTLCNHLKKISIQMQEECTITDCQCNKSQTSLVSQDKVCMILSSVEELYSVLDYVMEKTTIFTEAEKNPLIIPKTYLSMLYEKVLLLSKRIAKSAEQIQFLKMEEQEYKPTTVTIMNLLKLCGYVKNVIMNGTNIIKLSKGGFCEAASTIDIVTGGFP